jgi:hypothetical protein
VVAKEKSLRPEADLETRGAPPVVEPEDDLESDPDVNTQLRPAQVWERHAALGVATGGVDPTASASRAPQARAPAVGPETNPGAGAEHATAPGDVPPGASDGSGGTGLPDNVRGKFEASLGVDLSGVRVHTDGAPAGTKAATVGQHIHVAPDHYDPHGQSGQELLAHEVAHTVQQRDATPQAQHKDIAPSTAPAERDADRAASAMVAGQRTSVTAIAQQVPHAKEAAWMAPIRSSLQSGNWDDVALRLNGLAVKDIYGVVKGFTAGERAHVRGAAQHVMAGWPEHVTEQIDKVAAEKGDANLGAISAKYAAYEKALASARAGGGWKEVADRLVGMGDWDRNDRLGKLSWAELQQLRGATDQEQLVTAINARLQGGAKTPSRDKVLEQLDKQIAVRQWGDVARRLNGLGESDLHWYVFEKLGFGQLAHVREAAMEIGGVQRVIAAIDQADPNAAHIAEKYWEYEQTVAHARATGDWHFAAARLSNMGDWDIDDRLGRLARPERLKIRELTTDQRVIDAIQRLEGTPAERTKALADAIKGERWGEAAERLNGLGDPELAAYLKQLRDSGHLGQLAHIRGAAARAMPGFSARVENAIEAVAPSTKDVSERYGKLEEALAAAKAGGGWGEVAVRLNGMNAPDVMMYLKQLDDAQLASLEAAPISAAVRDSIGATRTERLATARREAHAAIATGNWMRAARQLALLVPSDIEHEIEAILKRPHGEEDLASLRAAAASVPDGYRTIEWIDRLGPATLPKVAPPVTSTIDVPDVSGDVRKLAGLSLENFGGNAKIREFAHKIADEEGQRLQSRDQRKRDRDQIIAETFEALREGFITTAAWVPQSTFGEYAMKWMYETREMHEASSRYEGGSKDQWFNKMWRVLNTAPTVNTHLENFAGNAGNKIMVHPVVNKLLAGLSGAGVSVFSLTYDNHGGSKAWEPFCVDIMPNGMPLDQRGLYQRPAAIAFLRTVDRIVRGLDATWRGIYDDADFVAYANKEFTLQHDTGQIGEGSGVKPGPDYNVDAPQMSMTGDQGSKNWHGGLNLHFHFYVIPNSGVDAKP